MFHVVIPARLGSERFHGKLLQDLAGKPLLQHTYEKACLSGAQSVVIATDNEAIQTIAQNFGAEVCLTQASHTTGSDRVAEVCRQYRWSDETLVVNLQGDEPQMAASNIQQLVHVLQTAAPVQVASLYEPFSSLEDVFNPHCVKVVCDDEQHALYFSRAPVPWDREQFSREQAEISTALADYKHHLGIYAYTVLALQQFSEKPISPLEKLERLEQLRFLHYKESILMSEAQVRVGVGVNVQADLNRLSS